jgi:hypothetical protein
MRSRVVLTAVSLTFLMAISSVVIGTNPQASAHNPSGCDPTPNVGRWYGATVRTRDNYGGQVQIHEQNYVPANAGNGGWAIHRLLVASKNSPSWVEVGYGWGWDGQNIPHFYQGRVNNSGSYGEWKLSKSAPTPAVLSNWHTYNIDTTSSSSSAWIVRVDGVAYGSYAPSSVAKPGEAVEAGSETNQSASTIHITNALNPLYKWANDSTWYHFGSNANCYQDHPFHFEWFSGQQSFRFWGP